MKRKFFGLRTAIAIILVLGGGWTADVGRADVTYVAHAGEEYYAPPHSKAAYRIAIEHGLDILKFDLHPTKDGQIVCNHDNTLEERMHWKVKIRDVTLDEIRQHLFRARGGYTNETIVTLSEALAFGVKAKLGVWLDFKEFSPEFFEQAIAECDRAGLPRERIMVATWTVKAIEYCRDRHPDIRRVLHTGIRPPDAEHKGWRLNYTKKGPAKTFEFATEEDVAAELIAQRKDLGLYGFNLPVEIIRRKRIIYRTPESVLRALKADGAWLSMWFVEDEKTGERYRARGADNFVTSCAARTRPGFRARQDKPAAAVGIVAPREGETVEQLWPDVKAFLDLPREQREKNRFGLSEEAQKSFRAHVGAKPVEFAWKGDEQGVYSFTVMRLPDGKVFVETTVTGCATKVTGRLEVARDWKWTVSDGTSSASGTFKTEDRAPRIVSLEGVRNARDLGGWIGLNGRRVKQGMALRTGGLNYNAKCDDDKCPIAPGAERLTPADRDYLLNFWKIRSDLDLRGDWETFGMLFSPLGKDVAWRHFETRLAYGGFVRPLGRACQTLNLTVFTDEKAYPIDFHCIGGMDRTGTLAYLLNGFLGVAEEDLIRDYEMSFIGAGGVDKRHYEWLMSLVKAVRELPGDTLADKIWGYYRSLGYTDESLTALRERLLEPKS